MNYTELVVGMLIGVIWLAGCILLIRKLRGKKILKIVITAILFVLFAGIFIGARIGAAAGAKVLGDQADGIKASLIENYSNLAIVSPGVEVSAVGPELDRLEAMIPGMLRGRGLSAIFSETLYKQALSNGFAVIKSHTDMIAQHAVDGRITSSTIIDALVWSINNTINGVIFWITVIIGFFMALRLGLCFLHLAKEKKAAAAAGE